MPRRALPSKPVPPQPQRSAAFSPSNDNHPHPRPTPARARILVCIHAQAETESPPGALQVRQREAGARARRISTSWPHQSWQHLLHEFRAARRTSHHCRKSILSASTFIFSIQLVASQELYNLVHFDSNAQPFQTETSGPILAKRSPQLTNGHGLGGSADHEHVSSMPLGDAFVRFLLRAWTMQDNRRREIGSPRSVHQISYHLST
jgi:hypothetical protein